MPKEWKKQLLEQATQTNIQEQAPHPYEAALLAAEIGKEAPSIDLHGLSVNDATNTVDAAINQAFVRSIEVMRIIHGRGSGALRTAIHALLKQLQQAGLIAAYRDATHHTQQGGVTLVALHRPK